MGFARQYNYFIFNSQSRKNSRIYFPLTLKQLTNYDFNRTGEFKTYIIYLFLVRLGCKTLAVHGITLHN